MKKVCIVTAARSEYGLLRWVIDEVHKSNDLELHLVVTGSHLSKEQGYTYKTIEKDGYPIAEKIDINIDSSSQVSVCKSMAICQEKFADTLYALQPDVLVVLGDRYELLPICSTALMQNIPIAHIAGGEITEGAIDNQVRNAVTMIASIHFPNNESALMNIARIRGTDKNVFNVGEPCIENYCRLELKKRVEIAEEYGFDIEKKWFLVTLHPETHLCFDANIDMANNMLSILMKQTDCEVIITGSNSDYGGALLNNLFKQISAEKSNFYFFSSLGQINYLSCMKESFCVIGNSSSGVIETPYLGVPTVNIGNRQLGRYISANVACSSISRDDISDAIKRITQKKRYRSDFSFGDGKTSLHIISHLKQFLYERE